MYALNFSLAVLKIQHIFIGNCLIKKPRISLHLDRCIQGRIENNLAPLDKLLLEAHHAKLIVDISIVRAGFQILLKGKKCLCGVSGCHIDFSEIEIGFRIAGFL